MKPPRVLLFDVFGTLVDWRSSLIDIAMATGAGPGIAPGQVSAGGGQAGTHPGGAGADWAGLIDDWRRAYQPAMDQVRQGAAWRDLDSLQRETLAATAARHGIDLPAAASETLVRGWRQLRPWPDSREGLERLRPVWRPLFR